MPARPVCHVAGARAYELLLDDLESSASVALDTEFVSEKVYQPDLCLVQLATANAIYIVDPIAMPGLERMWELITAPERQMLAHAAREEIRFCLRYAGRPPADLWDPQLAAGLLGMGYPMAHTQLVLRLLKVQVSGSESLTDWRRRPLSTAQIEYAADDVRYLHAMREALLIAAASISRKTGTGNREEWIAEECAAHAERVTRDEADERWWRVSGAGNLGRRDKAVLREVWRWREALAYEQNLPPRWVLRDELLAQVAKRKPASTADLFALRGFERGDAREKGPAIVAAVQRGLAVPDSELPGGRRRDDPPQLSVLSQMLSVVSGGVAAHNSIESQLLAPSADIQEFVRWVLTGRTDDKPELAQGWRGDLLGEPLLDVLEGRSFIVVEDLARPNPLSIRRVT